MEASKHSVLSRTSIAIGAVFLTSGLVVTPSVSVAQATGTAVLEEVTVTARKKEESLSDVPISISAVSGDFLQESNLSDLLGLADEIPNLSFGEAFNSSDRFAIRGVSTNGNNIGFEQAVGFNIDGYYFGRSRFGQTMFLDLERVEVLKGPQNTLIGKNNTAGAINITTRKPGDEFGGYLATSYDFEAGEGFAVEGAVDLPLGNNVRSRIAARLEDKDGYMEHGLTGSDVSGARDNFTIRGIVQWDITERVDATLLYQYGEIDRGARPREAGGNCNVAHPIDDCSYNNVKYEAAFWAGENREDDFVTETDYSMVGLTFNWQLNDSWTLSSLTNFTSYEGNDLSESNFDQTIDATLAQIQDEFEQFSQEVRLLGSLSESVDLIAGVYYNDNTVDAAHSLLFCGGPVNCSDASSPTYGGLMRNFDSTQDAETISVFGQIDFSLGDTLTLGIGGRFTTEDKKANGRKWVSDLGDGSSGFVGHQMGGGTPLPGTDFAGGGGCTSLPSLGGPRRDLNGRTVGCYGPLVSGSNGGSFSRSEDDFSPNAVLTWQPSDEHMLYVSYSEGFKGGGYQLWPVGGGALTAAEIEFDGETAESFEAGGKHTLLASTLQVNWSAWSTEVQGLQVAAFDPVITAQNIVNAGQTTSEGVEGDFIWLPDASHRISASFAYTDATYDSYEGANCYPGQTPEMGCVGRQQSLTGQSVSYAPEWQYIFSVDGAYSFAANMEWGWRAAYNWRDDQFIGTTNHPAADVQEAYGKFNASLFLASADGKWRVSLIGTNLNDENVGTGANHGRMMNLLPERGVTPAIPTLVFMAPGRQVAIQGRFNF
jgi:outer membrane receptor protein involved in Fe transport